MYPFSKLALALLIMGLPASALALEAADLQGKWVITSMNGEDDGDRSEVWEFKGDQWIAWSSGRALPADKFTIKGAVVDLGYAQIKILEHSESHLKTEQMGFTYTLEKQ